MLVVYLFGCCPSGCNIEEMLEDCHKGDFLLIRKHKRERLFTMSYEILGLRVYWKIIYSLICHTDQSLKLLGLLQGIIMSIFFPTVSKLFI